MKRWLIGVAGLTIGVVLLSALLLRASSWTFIGSLQTVNNTTSNSTGLAVGSYAGSGTFWIQNGGLSTTNNLLMNVQLSADNTNFITVATYYPSGTAATNEVFYPSFTHTLYMRAQVVTTSNVTVGVVYQY